MKRKKKGYIYIAAAGLFALYVVIAYNTQIPYNPVLVEKQLIVNIR